MSAAAQSIEEMKAQLNMLQRRIEQPEAEQERSAHRFTTVSKPAARQRP